MGNFNGESEYVGYIHIPHLHLTSMEEDSDRRIVINVNEDLCTRHICECSTPKCGDADTLVVNDCLVEYARITKGFFYFCTNNQSM